VGTLANLVLSVLELLLVAPATGAVVAVSFYALAVAVFAPMQFMFSNRVPRVPLDHLPIDRLSRVGLAVTALGTAAMVVLAAAGGVRLG
jgi:hypothetical protein